MIQQIPAGHLLVAVLAIDHVSLTVQVQPLMTRNTQWRFRAIVGVEEVLDIGACNNTGTLVVKQCCWVALEDADVEVFAETPKCNAHEQTAQ
jgi:hypothetical protein